MIARSLFFFFLFLPACIPDTTGGSSGSSGGGIVTDASSGEGSASEGGGDGASSIPPDREALCSDYATATASCCDATPGACTSNTVDRWKQYCETYAASCAAMPTCFSGSDCNTLIYCTSGC